MPLDAGSPQTIAHFRVIDLLGQGGMGVVYRAEDQKLGRPVALKVLPARAMHDEERRRRFLREARAAAAVRHRSIATIYEVGESDGRIYIAMELCDGRTLRDVVDSDGPLRVEDALRTMLAIVDALASAHDEGVIHRDLKDDNVMRTADGEIKLLDFGIAKHIDGDSDTTFTAAGVPMGTPGYMSPEQARGDQVDHRSDIFAAGVVLVRLVTGDLPFHGDSAVELSAAPLQQAPDLSAVPDTIRPIAARCLARNLSDRYADCGALRADLAAALEGPRRRAQPRWPLVAGAAALLGALGLWWVAAAPPDAVAPSPSTSPEASGSSEAAPRTRTDASALRHRALTTASAKDGLTIGAISPDGTRMAYSHSSGVFTRDIDSGAERKIADNPGGELKPIDWLPSKNAIVCRTGGESPSLWSLSVEGEREPLYAPAFMAAVSPGEDRMAIAAVDGLRIVSMDGSEDRLVVPLPRREAQELGMRWSADGRRLLFARPVDEGRTVRVETLDVATHTSVLAFDERALVGQTAYRTLLWLSDGRFVASITEPPPDNLGTNFWETWIDPQSGVASGPLTRLTSWPSSGLWWASASRDGKRVALTMVHPKISILTARLADDHSALTSPLTPLASDGSSHWPSAWLDDDTLLYTSNRRGHLDVFAHPAEGDRARPLLQADAHDTYALPRPDGLLHWRIAWDADKSGVESRLTFTPGDGASKELLTAPIETARFTFGSASPIGAGVRCSGDRCVVGEKRDGSFIIFALEREGRGAQLARVEHGGGLLSWDLSPDGNRIALLEARLDHATSSMRIFERGRGQRDVPLDRSCSPTGLDWSSEDELFLTCYDDAGHLLLRVGIDGTTRTLHHAGVYTELWQPIASPNGKRIMVRQDVTPSAIWLVEGW